MSGNPESKDSRMEGAGNHSESDADMDSSSSEGHRSPSPPQKPVKEALKALKASKKSLLARGKEASFQFDSVISTQPTAFVSIPVKRPQGLDFQTSPGGRRKDTTASRQAREAEQSRKAKEKIQEARNYLVEAASLLSTLPSKQTKVLDLIEIFRAYTEKDELPKTANILATQTNALDKTIRRLQSHESYHHRGSPAAVTTQCPGGDPTLPKTQTPASRQTRPTFANITRQTSLLPASQASLSS